MVMWQKLIFDYAKSLNKYVVTYNELYESPICQNKEINRRLKMDSIIIICEWMVSKKLADFTSTEQQKDKIFVYWRSTQDIAEAIFKWAKDTARIGSIETLLDIIDDEFQKDQIFYQIPIEIALNALYLL